MRFLCNCLVVHIYVVFLYCFQFTLYLSIQHGNQLFAGHSSTHITIDLLEHSTHNPTSEFLDLIFAYSFTHLIKKPTQITPTTATLIDNIVADKYDNEHIYLTKLLTTDISDHYPIVHISLCQNKPTVEDYKLIRLIDGSNLDMNNIQNHNWSLVNHHDSCQTAFTYFFWYIESFLW